MPVSAYPAIKRNPVSDPNQPEDSQTFSFRHLNALKAELSITFNDHDKRLNQRLEGARAMIEKLTGVLLIEEQIFVSWAELYDWEDLPWGPIHGSVTITTLDGLPLTATLSQELFPRLYGNFPKGIKLEYTGGYSQKALPPDLLDSAINLAANNFDGGDREWRSAVFTHRQGSFIQ